MTPWEKRGWPRTIANTVAVAMALVPIVLVVVLVR